jgi:hypothetical protein
VADFDVKVAKPKGMQVFASGANVGAGHWRAVASGTSLSRRGGSTSSTVSSAFRSRSSWVAAAKVFHLVPPAFVDAAVQALRTFSERYAPYPWSTYTVVVVADRPELERSIRRSCS